jgi:hypothetical protein
MIEQGVGPDCTPGRNLLVLLNSLDVNVGLMETCLIMTPAGQETVSSSKKPSDAYCLAPPPSSGKQVQRGFHEWQENSYFSDEGIARLCSEDAAVADNVVFAPTEGLAIFIHSI